MIFAAFAIAVYAGAFIAGLVVVAIVGTYVVTSIRDWLDRETR